MTTPKHILDHAIEQDHHTRTPRKFGRKVRERMKSLPSTTVKGEDGFSKLEEGQTYIAHTSSHRGAYSAHKYRVLTLQRITPKGTQAVVFDELEGQETRLYEGKERETTFYANDGQTAQLARKEHSEVVEHAVLTGHDIPPNVRRHHPGLFIRIPKRYEAKRVRKVLTGLDAVTAEGLRDRLAARREKLSDREGLFAEKVEEGRDEDTLELCLGLVESTLEQVEFYEWLLPHVESGPFSFEKTAA